jgi:hypothetical protein
VAELKVGVEHGDAARLEDDNGVERVGDGNERKHGLGDFDTVHEFHLGIVGLPRNDGGGSCADAGEQQRRSTAAVVDGELFRERS